MNLNNDWMRKIAWAAYRERIFRRIGRMGTDKMGELEAVINAETSGRSTLLELRDLTLVGHDVVSYLGRCEADGVEIEKCQAYIRE
jgi:hypothetical protein